MSRMRNLSEAIRHAENSQLDACSILPLDKKSKTPFLVVGEGVPKDTIHLPTTTDETRELLDNIVGKIKLPKEIHLADLGSGLGSFACSASIYCDQLVSRGIISKFSVTGFDISSELIEDAARIAKEQKIRNVSFLNRDFTKFSSEDLKPYNLVYIYQSFKNPDLEQALEKVFPLLAPNAKLITRLCGNVKVLRSDLFWLAPHPLQDKYSYEYGLFVRTEK